MRGAINLVALEHPRLKLYHKDEPDTSQKSRADFFEHCLVNMNKRPGSQMAKI